MRLGLLIVAVLASGCFAGGGDYPSDTDDYLDMDTPPGNCSATVADPCPDPPSSSGTPEGGACNDSEQCTAGSACVAPFDDGEVGDFTCSSQCIALDDESRWCIDASACCDPGAVCSARGLCVPEGGLDDSGTATGTDTGGGTASTGTDGSGTTSETGTTSEGTSSDTGAATGTTGMQ